MTEWSGEPCLNLSVTTTMQGGRLMNWIWLAALPWILSVPMMSWTLFRVWHGRRWRRTRKGARYALVQRGSLLGTTFDLSLQVFGDRRVHYE